MNIMDYKNPNYNFFYKIFKQLPFWLSVMLLIIDAAADFFLLFSGYIDIFQLILIIAIQIAGAIIAYILLSISISAISIESYLHKNGETDSLTENNNKDINQKEDSKIEENTVTCTRCGNSLKPSLSYCEKCGYPTKTRIE